MKQKLLTDAYDAVNTLIENTQETGEETLRVVKANKQMIFDTNTYAVLNGVDFHNGIIECDMMSRLLPEAPNFARGFIGIVFRLAADGSVFESFYVRPTNGRNCDDPVRKAHGCQYFTYPEYTFAYYRDHEIIDYEAPTDVALNEWIHLKAVIRGAQANFYIQDMEKPVLHVDQLKLGPMARGGVGFFVDIGTEAFYKNLNITVEA